MKHRILLIGYYGKGNAGDEWLKIKTLSILEKSFPNLTLSESKKRFFHSNMIVYGGGGLFQNKTSNRSLLYYCFWVILATVFRKPVYMVGQGFGPIKGKAWNVLTQFCLRQAKAISVRDTLSLEYTLKAGVPHSKCILAPDLAFYDSFFIQTYSPPSTIWLNLRPWPHTPKNWSSLCEYLREQSNEFLACSVEDLKFSKHLPSTNLISQIQSPKNKKPHLIIAMRFHACVWAALQGIPFIALAYDDKVTQLAKTLDQPYLVLNKEPLELSVIKTLISDTLTKHHDYQIHLRKTLPKLLEEAMKHDTIFRL